LFLGLNGFLGPLNDFSMPALKGLALPPLKSPPGLKAPRDAGAPSADLKPSVRGPPSKGRFFLNGGLSVAAPAGV